MSVRVGPSQTLQPSPTKADRVPLRLKKKGLAQQAETPWAGQLLQLGQGQLTGDEEDVILVHLVFPDGEVYLASWTAGRGVTVWSPAGEVLYPAQAPIGARGGAQRRSPLTPRRLLNIVVMLTGFCTASALPRRKGVITTNNGSSSGPVQTTDDVAILSNTTQVQGNGTQPSTVRWFELSAVWGTLANLKAAVRSNAYIAMESLRDITNEPTAPLHTDDVWRTLAVCNFLITLLFVYKGYTAETHEIITGPFKEILRLLNRLKQRLLSKEQPDSGNPVAGETAQTIAALNDADQQADTIVASLVQTVAAVTYKLEELNELFISEDVYDE